MNSSSLQSSSTIASAIPSPGQVSEVLRKRAHALAAQPARKSASSKDLVALEFALAYERYAVSVAVVQEVCLLRQCTRLPCAPTYLSGIMNLRGKVLAILDLQNLLNIPRKGLPYQNRVIVLNTRDSTLGLLADEIAGVRILSLDALLLPLATIRGPRLDYYMGITPDGTTLLDGDRLLSDRTLVLQEEVPPLQS